MVRGREVTRHLREVRSEDRAANASAAGADDGEHDGAHRDDQQQHGHEQLDRHHGSRTLPRTPIRPEGVNGLPHLTHGVRPYATAVAVEQIALGWVRC